MKLRSDQPAYKRVVNYDTFHGQYSKRASETVQPRRVVDEDLALQLRLRHHLREEIHEVAVVRHVLADVGMRPVGAPEDALGRSVDELPREWNGVRERRARR